MLLPPLFPVFIRDFGLTYAELGLLVTVFFIISGVGQALAGFVVDRFGARRVRISVFPQRQTLIAWYQRLGYSPTGETLPFPYGNPRFGLPLRDDLYFLVMECALDRGPRDTP